MLAMTYGTVYVAQTAMGASDVQTVRAFAEADSYPGPSLIIAYSHCIAHGIDMKAGQEQQKAAVASGAWPLYRFDPRLAEQGKNPLQLDSKDPSVPLEQYIANENRWRMLHKTKPEEAKRLAQLGQKDVMARWRMLKHLAAMDYADSPAEA
jgi:pyruvate-ferredoxin/flavodoxin oxidoreductase